MHCGGDRKPSSGMRSRARRPHSCARPGARPPMRTVCPASQAAAAGQAMGRTMEDRKTGSVRAAASSAARRQRAASARPAATKSAAAAGGKRSAEGCAPALSRTLAVQCRTLSARAERCSALPGDSECTAGWRRGGGLTQALLGVRLSGEAHLPHSLQQVAGAGDVGVKPHLPVGGAGSTGARGVGPGGSGRGWAGKQTRRCARRCRQGSAALRRPAKHVSQAPTSTTPVSRLTEASRTPATWRSARSTAEREAGGRDAQSTVSTQRPEAPATWHSARSTARQHRQKYVMTADSARGRGKGSCDHNRLQAPSCARPQPAAAAARQQGRATRGGAPVPEQDEQVMPPTCSRATFTSSLPSTGRRGRGAGRGEGGGTA